MTVLDQILSITEPVKLRKLLIQYVVEHPNDKENIINVIDKYPQSVAFWERNMGEPFETNPNKWTDIYYHNLQIRLMNNFSKEKFLHTLDVAEYIEKHQSSLLSENSNEKIKLYGKTMGFIMVGGVSVFIVIVVLMVFYFKNKYT
ncbi:hypothetical protein ACIQ4I_00945 [Rummeliibacillus sp. NPDC094406]|uniref:hypothetical protein n=1 Tax=Rummeliibacillus sp. NPDC094406 TaxID=3364511 RepID=UPI0038076687